MRPLLRVSRLGIGPLAVVIGLFGPSPVAAQYLVDVSFDDEPSGTGAGTGHGRVWDAEGPPGALAVRLVGGATRSSVDEGRYGRGVRLGGAEDAVVAQGWTPSPVLTTYLYLRTSEPSVGLVVAQAASFAVGIDEAGLYAGLRSAAGASIETRAFGLGWPRDGEFHHLGVQMVRTPTQTRFRVRVDFGPEATVTFDASPAPSDAPLTFGRGLVAVIDELNVSARPFMTRSLEADRFNRMADACPPGLRCHEELVLVSPPSFGRPVPVRMKTVHDPSRCTETRRCPLVVEVSGGNACANDYSPPEVVAALAAESFVVLTVDPYCEVGRAPFWLLDHEIPMLIAAKDFAMTEGMARGLVSGPEYMASGCSHGAEAVRYWAIEQADHPARTFSRSGTGAGHCGHAAGKICGFEWPTELDVEAEAFRARHTRLDLVGRLDRSTVASRELAVSWGVNQEGPVCHPDGTVACSEEGKWAMTYASRRLRNRWEALEPPGQPTGYFVEDASADCQHCAPPGTEAFRCGLCLLRHGRAGMSAGCPACVAYANPTVDRGGAAELCPLEASWYTDPLAPTPGPDGGLARPDGGDRDGGTDDAEPPPTSAGSGCSCRALRTRAP